MTYVILVPEVQQATITPNPVSANNPYVLAVKVTEIEKILEPIIRYCGTFYCGEEDDIE